MHIKSIPFFTLPVMFLMAFAACKKSTSGSNDPTPQPPAPTPPAPYIVKTIGVGSGGITLDSSRKIFRLRFSNGNGNVVQLWPGSDMQLELANANSEPQIVSANPQEFSLTYPNFKPGPLGSYNVVPGDSATYLHFKIKGFTLVPFGFHQLNVIICADGGVSTGVFGVLSQLPLPPNTVTNDFIKGIMNTRVNKLQIAINYLLLY